MKTMQWLLTIFCILSLTTVSIASDVGIYRISVEARDLLVEMKSTVRHGQADGYYIAELLPSEVDRLVRDGFAVELLYESAEAELQARRLLDGTDEFHSYDQIRDGFYALAASYPGFTVMEHLGYSVQNRELFALKITANPSVEENEPEIVFWGCIHGNEYAAAEVPYLYAIYLCENYGVDPDITEWIDNNEIWCIPVINPDGRVNGSRNNANGIDLNRDLGYQWDGWGSSWFPFSQVETRAIREFCMDNNVTLSTTHHCSGDVLFYQWGYTPQNAPDDDLIVRVGERYANAASYALVNSWEDYETHGEVLDYVYGSHGALCYTVEISNSSSQMQYTYERNQAGMDVFCELAGEGVHGIVTDAQTSEPLRAAVWIDGNPIPSYTDPEVGDLHRLLLPGTYDLTVWANGYFPQTVENVTVAYGAPGQFEVQLEPGGGQYAFAVTSVNQEDPSNAHQNATTPAWALGEPDNLPCSIGANGFIVLDMGAGHEIFDGPGDDFTITEWDHPRDPGPETYRVYAGDAYVQDILIGQATGTASFDLASAGMTFTRYLKILDASGSSPSFPLAGMDLDAVTILNSAASEAGTLLTEVSVPSKVELSAHPNPFNPVTLIGYQLSDARWVNLSVYDVSGRKIAELVDGWRDAGVHQVAFDGSNLASGVYFYRLQSDDYSTFRKLVLVR